MSNQAPGLVVCISLTHQRFAQSFLSELKSWVSQAPEGIPLLLHAPSCVLPVSWSASASNYIPLARTLERAADGRSADTAEAGFSGADRDYLKELLANGRLFWLSAGFSGAVYPLLTAEEARLDAEWARTNPWKSGLIDNFGTKGIIDTLLTPLYPDPLRLDVRLSCLRTWSRIGLGPYMTQPASGGPNTAHQGGNPGGNGAQSWYLWAGAHEFEALPYMQLGANPGKWPSGSAVLQQAASFNTTHPILLGVEYKNSCKSLDQLLKIVLFLKNQGCSFESQLVTQAVSPELEKLVLPRPNFDYNPEMAMRVWSVSEQRRSRSSVPERTKSQLLALRPEEPGSASLKQPKEDKRKKGLLAHMQGSALLMGGAFNAVFQDSQLIGLDRAEQRILELFPADVPSISWAGTQLRYERESAVSFETERSHGMRLSLVAKHPALLYPGKTSVDYFFIDDSPWLFIEIMARFPWFKDDRPVDQFVPYQISWLMDSAAQEVAAEWVQLDGRPLHARVPIPALDNGLAKLQQKEKNRQIARGKQDQNPGHGLTAFLARIGDFAQSHFISKIQPGSVQTEVEPDRILLPGWSWAFTPGASGQFASDRTILVRRLGSEKETMLPLECSIRRNRHGTVFRVRPELGYQNITAGQLRGVEQRMSIALCPAWALDPTLVEKGVVVAPHQGEFSPFLDREIHPSSVWRQI